MEPLTFVIAIMGCADSGAMCQQQRVEAQHYATAAACQAAVPAALMRNTDIMYPVVEATCQQTTPRWADKDGAGKQRG
ncbi:hypothetical protein KY084_10740 [Stakelama sp. CBK3Z-3]|uniref:Lipoprotein n=1 Tax=Stakelama flava TaxID=2860338 RepID=A0ABS6XMB4_9SPHN|nr:hypothetical protein [Stakelama flava]MBW4331349.1 hypothetical protein [Stakelama flava]